MEWTNEMIEKKMTVEKVKTLLTALEIFANGDPIGIGLDEVKEVAKNAIISFEEDDGK